jgi:hypothetical protein
MSAIYTTIQNQYQWYGTQKAELVSPQYHVIFYDNFDIVQAPDPNVKHSDTMDHLFKTNSYKYDHPFGNEHMYLFSYGGVDIHPENITPNIKTCQELLVMTSTHDDHHSATQSNASTENIHNNKSMVNMQDLMILHANNIFPQNNKDDFKALNTYTSLTCKYTQFQNHQKKGPRYGII